MGLHMEVPVLENLYLAQVTINSLSFNWILPRERKFEIHSMKTWRNCSSSYCKFPVQIDTVLQLSFQSHSPHNTWYTQKACWEETCCVSIWAFCTVMCLNWLGVHLGCYRHKLWSITQNCPGERLSSQLHPSHLRTQRKMPGSLFLDILSWELGMEKFQSGELQIYKSLSGMFCSSRKRVWKLQKWIGGRGRCKV